jgi:hypothetical protein
MIHRSKKKKVEIIATKARALAHQVTLKIAGRALFGSSARYFRAISFFCQAPTMRFDGLVEFAD